MTISNTTRVSTQRTHLALSEFPSAVSRVVEKPFWTCMEDSRLHLHPTRNDRTLLTWRRSEEALYWTGVRISAWAGTSWKGVNGNC